MKFTRINLEPVVIEARFNAGDFFITHEGFLRQVVRIGPGQYVVMRPDKGVPAIQHVEQSAQDAVQHYVDYNGPVTKAEVSEIIYSAKENEKLHAEVAPF